MSQETHYVSATNTNLLMPCRETVAVYCENHTEHTNTLCGRMRSFSALNQFVHIVITGLYRVNHGLQPLCPKAVVFNLFLFEYPQI
jgi:hypothetical protein